ncbi:hypothetical protein ACTHQF_03760 [Pedobacter sp. SAFR-022]|uniref:hypothetical protein n=1 Tax=Pedobacter sp. SAFR-022 TaxID=3436861 RepID=UPI003F7F687C
MGNYISLFEVRSTNQTLLRMGAKVLLMAADRFTLALILNLLVMMERCPWGKRKKEHPQHSCSQHSLDIAAFLVHLHAKLNKKPFLMMR